MMVPFKKSHEYEELSSIAISRDKPYLKTLMEKKINHLEQAIAYVNYEHCKLFTMQLTCIRRPVITIQLSLPKSEENWRNSK